MVEVMITALLTGAIMSLVCSGVALLKAKLFRKKAATKLMSRISLGSSSRLIPSAG